ncbi:MAG TPA: hypothetical protein VHT52_12365 [Stellaceae bacterium]|jgi:hypothetical protein|nr:hypothetical protein [Stellaceae bacterium]
MPRDADIDKILRPSGKAPPAAAASSSDSTADDEGGVLDVGRGALKSLAGTAVALPRLANAGVGLASSRWRNRLGELAEQVPGVQSLESFADSPNKTWGESLGYWGGEGAQLFGPSLLGVAAKGAEGAEALTAGGKAAEEAGGVLDWSRARTAPTQKALPPPREVPFIGGGDPLTQVAQRQSALKGAEYAEGLQANRAETAAARAREPISSTLNLRPAAEAAETSSVPLAQTAGRIAGGAARGGVAGAMMDPQDPGTGFLSGGAFGAAAPALGALANSRLGNYLGGAAARSTARAALWHLARVFHIHPEVLWMTGILPAVHHYHSPLGRALTRGGQAAMSGLGRAAEGAGRVPGGLAGAAAQGIESDDD